MGKLHPVILDEGTYFVCLLFPGQTAQPYQDHPRMNPLLSEDEFSKILVIRKEYGRVSIGLANDGVIRHGRVGFTGMQDLVTDFTLFDDNGFVDVFVGQKIQCGLSG